MNVKHLIVCSMVCMANGAFGIEQKNKQRVTIKKGQPTKIIDHGTKEYVTRYQDNQLKEISLGRRWWNAQTSVNHMKRNGLLTQAEAVAIIKSIIVHYSQEKPKTKETQRHLQQLAWNAVREGVVKREEAAEWRQKYINRLSSSRKKAPSKKRKRSQGRDIKPKKRKKEKNHFVPPKKRDKYVV